MRMEQKSQTELDDIIRHAASALENFTPEIPELGLQLAGLLLGGLSAHPTETPRKTLAYGLMDLSKAYGNLNAVNDVTKGLAGLFISTWVVAASHLIDPDFQLDEDE